MNKTAFAAAALLFVSSLPASPAPSERMYWRSFAVDTAQINRAHLDGSAIEVILTCSVTCGFGSLDIDPVGSKIYYERFGGQAWISRANLDGSNWTDILELGDVGSNGLAVDPVGRRLYVLSALEAIHRSDLDGSNVETVIEGLGYLTGITVDGDGGKMYWTEGGPAKLRRANLDGSGIEDLVTAPGEFRIPELDVTGGKVYWVHGDDTRRANLDGSNAETLPLELQGPSGIAFEPGARDIYLTAWLPGGTPPAPGGILRVDADTFEVVEILSDLPPTVASIALDQGSPDVPATSVDGLAAALLSLLTLSTVIVWLRVRSGC